MNEEEILRKRLVLPLPTLFLHNILLVLSFRSSCWIIDTQQHPTLLPLLSYALNTLPDLVVDSGEFGGSDSGLDEFLKLCCQCLHFHCFDRSIRERNRREGGKIYGIQRLGWYRPRLYDIRDLEYAPGSVRRSRVPCTTPLLQTNAALLWADSK